MTRSRANHRLVIHHGLDIDAYADGVASLARWPDQRAAVLRRLAVSEERWELCAAAFRDALVAEASVGRDQLAGKFRARFEATQARLAREQPDVGSLAPLEISPSSAERVAPVDPNAPTTDIDLARVRQAVGRAALEKSPGTTPPGLGTVELKGPFVPSALPFVVVSDEEVEAYAALTADLASFPESAHEVLRKHRVQSEDALAKERAHWSARFDKDVRLRMHWEGLHASFVGFVKRERARGKIPCL